MKNLFALLTVIGAGFVATPEAEARNFHGQGHTYVAHYTSCGCPVYVQRYVAYYDRCGYPVYRTRTLPVQHRCRNHGGHGYVQRNHGYVQRNRCNTHRGYGYGRSSGVRIGPLIIRRSSGSRCR